MLESSSNEFQLLNFGIYTGVIIEIDMHSIDPGAPGKYHALETKIKICMIFERVRYYSVLLVPRLQSATSIKKIYSENGTSDRTELVGRTEPHRQFLISLSFSFAPELGKLLATEKFPVPLPLLWRGW